MEPIRIQNRRGVQSIVFDDPFQPTHGKTVKAAQLVLYLILRGFLGKCERDNLLRIGKEALIDIVVQTFTMCGNDKMATHYPVPGTCLVTITHGNGYVLRLVVGEKYNDIQVEGVLPTSQTSNKPVSKSIMLKLVLKAVFGIDSLGQRSVQINIPTLSSLIQFMSGVKQVDNVRYELGDVDLLIHKRLRKPGRVVQNRGPRFTMKQRARHPTISISTPLTLHQHEIVRKLDIDINLGWSSCDVEDAVDTTMPHATGNMNVLEVETGNMNVLEVDDFGPETVDEFHIDVCWTET
jgi:hypothetical protein